MFSLLRLISLRHIVMSPLRSLLTVSGIAVGVATLVGIASINHTVTMAFRSTIDTIAGKSDISVAGASVGFPEEVLEKIRAIDGVEHTSGNITVIAPVAGAPGESVYIMGVDLLDDGYFRAYEGVDRDVSQIADDLEFLNSTDRMLLSERFATAHDLKTGSTFQLITPDGVKDFVVHGLLKETGPIKAFGGSVGVMFIGSAQEAFNRGRTFDRIDIGKAPGVDIEALIQKLKTALGPTFEVERPERRGQSVETMMRSFQLGLNLGSAVALLVGVFLVYNTVSIGVVQRRREIGTLRALGATKLRIRGLFTLEAFVFGAVGSVIGVPLGALVGRLAINAVSESISAIYVHVNAKEVQIGVTEVLIGMSVGIFGSMFAALRPAFVASSVQPVEALRRDVAAGAGAVHLRSWPTLAAIVMWALVYPVTQLPMPQENFPLGGYLAIFFILMGATLLSPLVLRVMNKPFAKPGELLLGISGRLAADNFARAPLRTAVPVSALAIGVAMAVTIGGFITSFEQSAERWIEQAIPADLFVTASAKVAGVQNQPISASLGDEIEKIEGIEVVDRVRIFAHDALGLRLFVVSLRSDVYYAKSHPQFTSGSKPTFEQRKTHVTISDNLARRRGLKAGDSFSMMTPTGEHRYAIAGVAIDYTSDQGTITMDRSLFADHFGDEQVDSFHVYAKDKSLIDGIRKRITEGYAKKYDLYVLTNGDLHQEALNLIGSAFGVTNAMEFAAIALALLGVVNTLLAAVLDRTREIGLLRAIGANRKDIVRLFAAEAGFIGITGSVIGLLMGTFVGYIVCDVINVQATGWYFPFLFPWKIGVSMLLVSSVFAVLAGLYPARRAAGLDVVEALAYE